MHYISSRGFGPVSFQRALLDGLAPDGGLYVPESYPTFSADMLESFTYLSYEEIAEKVMWPFVKGEIPQDVFRAMIDKAYSAFADFEVSPLLQYDMNTWLMELFYGPTLSFKDVAMQLLGEMVEYTLTQEEMTANVIGATSGDTGPAAIQGFADKKNVNVFMLFPHNRVSNFQRLQMTTSGARNVFPIAIDGTFDDCQALVKSMFNDVEFKDEVNATAVNSISWARLMPQMVYYFYAYSRLRELTGGQPLTFSVPTGNFGDAFAGYVAMQCGLPVNRLIIATNSNDILTRFFNEGDYSKTHVTPTRSPSMDIQVASNFERLLFDVFGRSASRVRSNMEAFRETGTLPHVNEVELDEVKSVFTAERVSEIETIKMMSEADAMKSILVDPHTAVGLEAMKRHDELLPGVVLSTAHPAKFMTAVKEAVGRTSVPLPEGMEDIYEKDEEYTRLPCDLDAVKAYIQEHIKGKKAA